MSQTTKYYNKFLFFTEFARSLIEMFIPALLYDNGFEIREVIMYLLFVSIFSFLISSTITLFYHRISDRFLVGFGGVSLFILFIAMQNIKVSIPYLIFIAFIYSLYRRCYWIGKRYYTVYTMSKENNAMTGGIIVTVSNIAKLLTSLIAGVLLDKKEIGIITFISFIAIFIGVSFLSKIKMDDEEALIKIKDESKTKKFKHEKVNFKSLLNVVKKHSIKDLIVLFGYEGLYLIDFFVPFYIFVFIKDKYTFLGIENLLLGLSSIIFVLIFSKRIDHTKRDYIRIMTICLIIITACEINVLDPKMILILSTIQGYFSKFHMVAYVRKTWCIDDDIDKSSYNIFLEMFVCIGRLILVTIIFALGMNIKMVIYFAMAVFMMVAIFKFKPNANL